MTWKFGCRGRIRTQAGTQHFETSIVTAAPLSPSEQNNPAAEGNGIAAFDVICLGAPVGTLVTLSPQPLPTPVKEKLLHLAHHTSVVFERQRLSNTLQHFLDRL